MFSASHWIWVFFFCLFFELTSLCLQSRRLCWWAKFQALGILLGMHIIYQFSEKAHEGRCIAHTGEQKWSDPEMLSNMLIHTAQEKKWCDRNSCSATLRSLLCPSRLPSRRWKQRKANTRGEVVCPLYRPKPKIKLYSHSAPQDSVCSLNELYKWQWCFYYWFISEKQKMKRDW